MNKKLFIQMWNERRSNVAVWFELFLISIALWYVVDAMFVRLSIYFQPRGMDISHTYLIKMGRLSPDNSSYQPDRSSWDAESEDVSHILQRISQRPDVEAAAISSYSTPYRRNWNVTNFLYHSRDSVGGSLREDFDSSGFSKVFRLEGTRGESREEIDEMFHESDYSIILAGEILRQEGVANADIEGLYYNHTPGRMVRKRGEVKPLRRNDYRDEWIVAAVIRSYPDYKTTSYGEMTLRVKEDQDVDFVNRFRKDAFRDYRHGNVYIRNIESMDDVRRNFHKKDESLNKIYYGSVFFMLFNAFIALFGVFWFRTRQRHREIALHVALGSTRRQVFIRLISEGIVLLILATIPAMMIDAVIVHAELVSVYKEQYFYWTRFGLTTGCTFLLIMGTIGLSIAYPAFKAARIQPAVALNESE